VAFDLKSIAKSGALKAPRIMLYGPHGLGKTTFGAGAPKPIFILTEDGLGRLEVDHFPLATTYQDVLDAIGSLYAEDHGFETVVIDSLDWLDTLVQTAVETSHDAQSLAYGKGAVVAAGYWRTILDGLSALRDDKGMAIVLLAHAEIKRFDSPETDPYDRYQPKLQARSSALVQEWCDAVLFANLRVVTKETDVGFKKKTRRGVATDERLIYTQERPAFLAKNRYDLPDSLPLSWGEFSAAINQTT
jgi:hypothetical protein